MPPQDCDSMKKASLPPNHPGKYLHEQISSRHNVKTLLKPCEFK